MNDKDKNTAMGLGLGLFLGWLLFHRKPTAGGNVSLHFNPTGTAAWYDVVDSAGNIVVPQSSVPGDATLSPGAYTVDMGVIFPG